MTLVRRDGLFVLAEHIMNIAGYRINLDALLARLIYRWRGRTLAAAIAVSITVGLASGLIPPFWRERAMLAIVAAPGARVQVDDRGWPHTIYGGAHTVHATMPDGRSSWADIPLRASQALTLTLPTGLAEPRERVLPPAAPGSHIAQVWWADGAWRVQSAQNPLPTARQGPAQTTGETPAPQPGQIVAVSAVGMERLPTLDAYADLADQVHVNNRLLEAVYRPNSNQDFTDRSAGTIEVRGWGAAWTMSISAPLSLLRFAPDGSTLLEAEHLPSGGQQVYLITEANIRTPVVAVPGQIVRLSWRPDSSAVVIHSLQAERLTLTLVGLAPTVLAAALADLPSASYAGAIVPLTWDAGGLLWLAPDPDGASFLWSAPLRSLIPERQRALEGRALTRLAGGSLRVLTIRNNHVVIGRYQDDIFIGEATLPRLPLAPDLAGLWQGSELLLQSGEQAWLLDLPEGDT
jgi:hypothetical protein